MQHLFVGVDGGATKCVVRIEDAAGNLLGREISGPANIRLSVTLAWQAVRCALNTILQRHGISLASDRYVMHAGMGLAGCEVVAAYQSFINTQHEFDSLVVVSDAHTACLGAHSGRDGAIIIAGTGVVGYQTYGGKTSKIGGWGFPHDDIGGGAWMGLQAVQLTLQSLDGRVASSALTRAVFKHFSQDAASLASWANQANSTDYAVLAPLVVQQAQQGDVTATRILQQAAAALDSVGHALAASSGAGALSCALIGGVTPFLQPYLSAELQARLCTPSASPDAGAILLIREHVANCQ